MKQPPPVELARTIASLAKHVLAGKLLRRDQALQLVEAGRERPYELLAWAGRVREACFADRVSLCAIVAGKLGACGEDCKWCAQSVRWSALGDPGGNASGDASPRYASSQDVLAAGNLAIQSRVGRLGIVNSGRRPSRTDIERLLEAVAQLRTQQPGLTICASLGELQADQARQLAQAGVQRYHHNLETSERFFGQMVTTHGYADRLGTLDNARQAGLSICSGGLFGLGESWEDRVDMALTLRDRVRPDSVPLNFLTPIAGTPLAGQPKLPPLESLTIIAVLRLLMPRADLRVCGGRLAVLGELHPWIFQAGATSCMTGNYLTTAGRDPADDLRLIGQLGLKVVDDQRGVYPSAGPGNP